MLTLRFLIAAAAGLIFSSCHSSIGGADPLDLSPETGGMSGPIVRTSDPAQPAVAAVAGPKAGFHGSVGLIAHSDL